jgi:hypothetical protein
MHRLRLVVTVAVIGLTTAAIGAAPVTKRPSTARVAPPQQTVPSTGTDVAEPAISTDAQVEQKSVPFELSTPSPEAVQLDAPTSAGVSGGNPINMDWYSVNNGGAIEVAAGNIKMGLSIGQNAVGEVSAGNIKMGLGFWYGAGTGSTPSCVCDCHADPECDGFTDILDVTALVSVAFRDGAPLPDPNGLCPYQTTDVNCSGFTDILDVTRMVEVAFRDGNPAAEFCSPCAPNL